MAATSGDGLREICSTGMRNSTACNEGVQSVIRRSALSSGHILATGLIPRTKIFYSAWAEQWLYLAMMISGVLLGGTVVSVVHLREGMGLSRRSWRSLRLSPERNPRNGFHVAWIDAQVIIVNTSTVQLCKYNRIHIIH